MAIVDQIIKLSRNLFPTGRAFKNVQPQGSNSSNFYKLMSALSQSESRAYADALSILDSALPDNPNFTIDDATLWEQRLGLITNSAVSLPNRILLIIAKMNFPGTIPARAHYLYVQGQLQAMGFPVYVYENKFGVTMPDLSILANHTPGSVSWTTGANPSISLGGITDSKNLYGALVLLAGITYTFQYSITSVLGLTAMPMFIQTLDAAFNVIDSVPIPTLAEGVNGGTVNVTPSANSTYVSVYATHGEPGSASSTITILNIIITNYITKSYSQVSGITASPFQFGDRQYGEFQFNSGYYPKVVNYIDEQSDAYFDEGVNLRSTFFIGGTPIGTFVNIPIAQKDQFRQAVLKLKQAQDIAYLFVNFV